MSSVMTKGKGNYEQKREKMGQTKLIIALNMIMNYPLKPLQLNKKKKLTKHQWRM